MLMRALLLFITLNAVSTYNCFGMELKNTVSKNKSNEEIISLNNGLLTEIPGKITKTDWISENVFFSKKIKEFYPKNDTVIKLWSYNVSASEANWQKCFAPLIIKITTYEEKRCIESLGQLVNCDSKSRKLHNEAKKAIDYNKALYWTYKQGVVIYSLQEQPNPSIVKHVRKLLNSNKNSITITEQ